MNIVDERGNGGKVTQIHIIQCTCKICDFKLVDIDRSLQLIIEEHYCKTNSLAPVMKPLKPFVLVDIKLAVSAASESPIE